jgi:chorismate-pyruvate lyase
MTRLLKAVERLALAVDTIEKNIVTTSNESDDAFQEMQKSLDQSLKENAELKNTKREVGDRLDKVIGQLSASLEN